MELLLRSARGDAAGTVEVSDALFGQPMNEALLHQALVMYRLNQRQGTHSTKTRAQVSGGGRKPWRQKGTGRARHGSTRAPQWQHGGVAFGPHPRDHRREMPRRMRHEALKCVLSEKVRGGKLILLDEITFPAPRTKAMLEVLKDLGVGESALIVTREPQQNLIRSAANIKKVWTLPVRLLNAYELLKKDTIVMTLEAARQAEELWTVERPKRKMVAIPEGEVTDEGEGLVAEAPPGEEGVEETVAAQPEEEKKVRRPRRKPKVDSP